MKKAVFILLAAGLLFCPACGKSDKPQEPAKAPAGVTNPYETQMQALDKAKSTAAMARERVAAEQEREKALDEATGR